MKIDNKTLILFRVRVFHNICSIATFNTETKTTNCYVLRQNEDNTDAINKIRYAFSSVESQNSVFYVGWRCHKYDCQLINYIISHFDNVMPSDIYYHRSKLDEDNQYEHNTYFYSIDLCKTLFAEKQRCTLRQMIFSLGLNVSEYDLPDIRENLEDINQNIENIALCEIRSFYQIYRLHEDKLSYRRKLWKEYKMYAFSDDDSLIGLKLMTTRYLQLSKKRYQDIQSVKSTASLVKVDDITRHYEYTFTNAKIREFWDRFKKMTLNPLDGDKKAFKEAIPVDINLILNATTGGVRTINSPKIYNGNIWKIDFSSMYPTVMCEYDLFPRHLANDFKKVYDSLRTDRIKAKEAKRNEKASALKLVLNSTIGMMKSEWSWLYDPNMNLAIRLTAMKITLSLVDYLYQYCEIIQVNTDGLFIKSQINLGDIDRKIYEFRERNNLISFRIDFDLYTKMFQYSVNDYIAVKVDDTIITKGIFSEQTEGKTLRPEIVRTAIINKLVGNLSVKNTINSCQDISLFCMSTNIENGWSVLYGNKKVHNNVRYYYTRHPHAHYLMKEKDGISKKVDTRSGVKICNDGSDDGYGVYKIPYYGMANEIVNQFYNVELFS